MQALKEYTPCLLTVVNLRANAVARNGYKVVEGVRTSVRTPAGHWAHVRLGGELLLLLEGHKYRSEYFCGGLCCVPGILCRQSGLVDLEVR